MDNRGGHRVISVDDLANTGTYGTINVGRSEMNNQGGVSDIDMGRASNSGYHSVMNIGLLSFKKKPFMV